MSNPFDYFKKKPKDIQLPQERSRDPRLPKLRPDPMEGLRRAGAGLAEIREKFPVDKKKK